ncbi:MAG: VOC family protein [Actinomycetota bacterium]|jgi:catechol 2,3-dioxygenase-like lactoylglutathione lyase family enzyme|nr:VOC family protein [Actinomycetota bacterium]
MSVERPVVDLPTEQFHVGARVGDLEVSMDLLAQALGLRWAVVVERDQRVWTPSAGATTVPLRFTYSCQGPQHVELLQGSPGSLWDGNHLPGLHHLGVWADDVAAETESLIDAGWTVDGAERPPEEGYGVMSYVRSPAGLLVELVSRSVEPAFERWWAGGELR